MAEGAVVARHDDHLRGFARVKRFRKLLNALFLQQRVIHRVEQERRASWNVPQRSQQGTELPFAPARIHDDPGIFRHGGTNQVRIASQDDNGASQPRAVGYGDVQGGLSTEDCKRFGKWQMRRRARGENNRDDVVVRWNGQEGFRIEQRTGECQWLRDSLRMQLVYTWDTRFKLATRRHSHYNAPGAARLARGRSR